MLLFAAVLTFVLIALTIQQRVLDFSVEFDSVGRDRSTGS